MHIWNGVPIPQYNPENIEHKELASLCVQAEDFVSGILGKLNLNYRQEKLSREMKSALQGSGISRQIDKIVREILPEQAR